MELLHFSPFCTLVLKPLVRVNGNRYGDHGDLLLPSSSSAEEQNRAAANIEVPAATTTAACTGRGRRTCGSASTMRTRRRTVGQFLPRFSRFLPCRWRAVPPSPPSSPVCSGAIRTLGLVKIGGERDRSSASMI